MKNIRLPSYSIKHLITAITVGMGLITLLLALLTGGVYRDLTIKGEISEIQEQLQQKTQDNMQRLKQHALQFGMILRNKSELQGILAGRDWKGLNDFLAAQLNSPFVSSGVLTVAQVNVYDDRLTLRNHAGKSGNSASVAPLIDCGTPMHVRIGRNVTGTIIDHAACLHENHPYLSVVVPVKAGATTAYLELLADLGYDMELLEEEVGKPLRVHWGKTSTTVYQSPHWPRDEQLKSVLLVTYDTPIAGTQSVFRIDTAHDHEFLFEALRKADLIIIICTSILTAIIVLLMLAVAKQTLLDPVRIIVNHMRNVRKDKAYLREKIPSHGIVEIRELADNFNTMSAELERLYQALEEMASTDALTSLGNRKQFHHNLSALAGTNERRSAPFALLVLDLDKFKTINDTLGHKAGDELLTQISERFVRELRDTDLVVTPSERETGCGGNRSIARLGGDEFAVLLPAIDSAHNAVTVAQKLATAASAPFTIGGVEVQIGVSIGIALYPKHSMDKDVLIHMADLAMYQAKNSGNACAVYDGDMEPALPQNRLPAFHPAPTKH